jgi:hypothetical protein
MGRRFNTAVVLAATKLGHDGRDVRAGVDYTPAPST